MLPGFKTYHKASVTGDCVLLEQGDIQVKGRTRIERPLINPYTDGQLIVSEGGKPFMKIKQWVFFQ